MKRGKRPPAISTVIARRREKLATRRDTRALIRRVIFLALVAWVLLTQVFLITQNSGQDMFPALKDGDLCFAFRTQAQTLMKQKYVRDDIVAYRVDDDGEQSPGPVRAWLSKVLPAQAYAALEEWHPREWLQQALPEELSTKLDQWFPVYTGRRHFGRVIASAGDVVNMGDNGSLQVNGTTQSGEIMYPTYAREGAQYPYRVPDGCLYVLGDYRTSTTDSRDYGPIPLERVEGKVITILRRRGL